MSTILTWRRLKSRPGVPNRIYRGRLRRYLHIDALVRRRLLAIVAAGIGAAVVNTFTLDVFGDARMYFGAILSLTVALYLGPLYGMLAATIGSFLTIAHPYSYHFMATHVLEAAIVGWCARNRALPILADAVYWCLEGAVMPLSHVTLVPSAMVAIVIKNLLNGLLNVTVADLFTGWRKVGSFLQAPPTPSLPLRTHLSRGFLLATAIPFLLLNIGIDWIHAARLKDEAGGHIHEAVARVVGDTNSFIDKHQAGVLAAADLLEHDSRLDLKHAASVLESVHRIYPTFRTMAYIGNSGQILAADPPTAPDGRHLIGADLSDRPYFKKTLSMGAPYVSDVFMSRQMGTDPIVTLTAPVWNPDGTIRGIAYGSLRCSLFKELWTSLSSLEQGQMLIVDQNDIVIYASPGVKAKPLDNLKSRNIRGMAAKSGKPFFSVRLKFRDSAEPVPLLASLGTTHAGWALAVWQPLSAVLA